MGRSDKLERILEDLGLLEDLRGATPEAIANAAAILMPPHAAILLGQLAAEVKARLGAAGPAPRPAPAGPPFVKRAAISGPTRADRLALARAELDALQPGERLTLTVEG